MNVSTTLECRVEAENADEAMAMTDFYDEADDVIANGTWEVREVDE